MLLLKMNPLAQVSLLLLNMSIINFSFSRKTVELIFMRAMVACWRNCYLLEEYFHRFSSISLDKLDYLLKLNHVYFKTC